ncbi:MAG: rhodanese-like domain-containing protein [Lentimicrobium sp.]|jgi:hypothetical protein|nr:rhodanese-like domain-containing protein [Lentimicrobium sp.]
MSEITKIQAIEAFDKINEGASFIEITDEYGQSLVAYDVKEPNRVTLLQLLEKLQWMDKTPHYIIGGYNDEDGFKAANLLFHQGFEHVAYIGGGIQSWFLEGLPVQYVENSGWCSDGGCGSGSCGSGGCDTSMTEEEDLSGGCGGGCSCGH